MAKVPTSLLIALWIVGSTGLVGLLAIYFDVSSDVVVAAFLFGLIAAAHEWLASHNNCIP